MKNIIREYFYYNKLERNGVFVLVLLCMLVLFLPKIYKLLNANTDATDFSSFKKEIAAFEKNNTFEILQNPEKIKTELFSFDPNTVSQSELQRLGLSKKVTQIIDNYRTKGGKFFKREDLKKVYGITEEDYIRLENFIEIKPSERYNPTSKKEYEKEEVILTVEPFEFDPNSASEEDLLSLGFSKRAASNLMKFRAKGGRIYEKENLSKIYGVDETLYQKLYPFITLEKQTNKTESKEVKEIKFDDFPSKSELVLDINAATIEDWQQLNGIGPFYAKRIVKFRNKLGGFYTIEQVKETYNLPDSTYQKILPQLKFSLAPQKLNVNSASVDELANHPYLKYNYAKVIINYRKQHGHFKDINDLKKIVILNAEVIEKIEHYLSFE